MLPFPRSSFVLRRESRLIDRRIVVSHLRAVVSQTNVRGAVQVVHGSADGEVEESNGCCPLSIG